jgi:hypothetical protein
MTASLRNVRAELPDALEDVVDGRRFCARYARPSSVMK